jgi:hypothetical protein
MRRFVAILLILIYLSVVVAQGDVDIPVTSGGARVSSSGGGSKSPEIENFIRQVEGWKNNYKDRFEYLQKLLYKPAWTNTSYVPPDVWLYYPPSDNKTINRTDEIKVEAIIQNTNPIEIRRALFLNLEIMEPGESSFKPAKTGVQIIQVNEYDENEKTARRVFPELSSFNFLKRVGEVKLRVSWTDGEYKLYSSRENSFPEYGYYPELALNVKNIPPMINNSTMKVDPMLAKWDDYIQYTASFEDTGAAQNTGGSAGNEENPVQVTLHIYNDSLEVFNKTKPFLPGDAITFSTRDASIFKESDASKNFTYRYSCTDGIKGGLNTTWSKEENGPNIRPNPRIKVTNLKASCEDENYYWWQNYNFSLEAKSQSSEPVDLKVDLYTDTPAHPGRFIASQAVIVPTNSSVDIIFKSMQPFDVADADQTFRYYFRYSAPDQNSRTQSDKMPGLKVINTKLIRYDTISGLGIGNIAVMLLMALLISWLVERRFYR